MFDKGEHVLADFGNHDEKSKYVLAHVRKADPVNNEAGETKYAIQAPDGSVSLLAYRETADVQKGDGVSGGTFKKV